MATKIWYNVILITNEGEEILAKVKSKGLAMRVKMDFQKIYANKIIIK